MGEVWKGPAWDLAAAVISCAQWHVGVQEAFKQCVLKKVGIRIKDPGGQVKERFVFSLEVWRCSSQRIHLLS